eukprot:CAMPEP_0184671814 /NCGR_PEP_ID=MMETSP0308-20130426/85725_1 /TAXON_ID=38269 /ORGANISM="Gloeochaete witrockiana, Strain SAG 46.84" /LENGTH=244 /DNA_ID=CAMNT_0027119013 /DNA_START=101 /DNA_END=835 /DNA_ORIENTATION=+
MSYRDRGGDRGGDRGEYRDREYRGRDSRGGGGGGGRDSYRGDHRDDDRKRGGRATRIYVGKVSSRTRERELEALFERYGRIYSVDLKQGFAFVEYEDSRDADDAVRKLDGYDLDGSRLLVEYSHGGAGYNRGPPPGTGKCFNCGLEGHWARDCSKGDGRGGGGGRRGRSGSRSPRRTSRSPKRSRSRSRSPGSRSPPRRTSKSPDAANNHKDEPEAKKARVEVADDDRKDRSPSPKRGRSASPE